MVAMEVFAIQKPEISSNMITSQVFEYVQKMSNLQSIETKKNTKIVMGQN